MKRTIILLFAILPLAGCGEPTATQKVEKFIETKDISLLSKEKTAQCSTRFLKEFHYFDENTLPTSNDYFEVSKYLYSKVKFTVTGEAKEEKRTIVSVKVSMPKPIEDAESFMAADSPYITESQRISLNNIKKLYEDGKLKDMQYFDFNMKYYVLKDGIDPMFTEPQLNACSKA
ncbi:hypothetical protein [Atlantibacter hermannii]|uniref:hypothetical protein n=1 Tax=Atlantibacter hermannii TaxID=565 RepID=UPI0028AF6C45|nr:hypothetical protein [Atlantibacter hermannii]